MVMDSAASVVNSSSQNHFATKPNSSFVAIELDFSRFMSRSLFKLILVEISLVTKFKSSLSLCVLKSNDKISMLL